MHDPNFVSQHPIDILIAFLSFIVLGVANVQKLRRLAIFVQMLLLLLRFYKHIGPMAKHYFDTHPVGKQLKRKTKLDNKINHLIKTHQLPYDKEEHHKKLKDRGAEG